MSITENDQSTYYLELMFILLNRDLIFEEKKTKSTRKKACEFIRINSSTENYDANYKASRIQVFISQFKENKIKEKDK